MKTISPELQAHLALGQTSLAYLWKVKRIDGLIFGFTTHDQDIVYDSGDGDGDVTYLARTGFTNTAVAGKSDLSVDNLEVTAFLDSAAISEQDLRAHLYDNSRIDILLVNWDDLTQGHMHIRRGTLGIVKMAGGVGNAEIRGLANKLTSNLGATYGPICRAEFGSGLNGIDLNSKYLCRIDVTAYQQVVYVNGIIGNQQLAFLGTFPGGGIAMVGSATPTTATPDGWMDNGIVKFTSGPLNGRSFEIKKWLGGLARTAVFFLPLPELPDVGDGCIIEPGCNHTVFDCQNKFANIINFRGEPFLPGEDAIMDYPDAQ